MQNFIAAEAQNTQGQRLIDERQEEVLRRHSQHPVPQSAYATNTKIVQEAFVTNPTDKSQSISSSSQTIINPIVSGSNQGPLPPPASGAAINKSAHR